AARAAERAQVGDEAPAHDRIAAIEAEPAGGGGEQRLVAGRGARGRGGGRRRRRFERAGGGEGEGAGEQEVEQPAPAPAAHGGAPRAEARAGGAARPRPGWYQIGEVQARSRIAVGIAGARAAPRPSRRP